MLLLKVKPVSSLLALQGDREVWEIIPNKFQFSPLYLIQIKVVGTEQVAHFQIHEISHEAILSLLFAAIMH